MNATLRNYIGAALAFMAMQTGCGEDLSFQEGNDPSADEDNEDLEDLEEVKSQTQKLYYPNSIAECERFSLRRWEYSYTGNRYRNMQAYSENMPTDLREWWNRTDCAGLVVDWVMTARDGGYPHDDSAFVTGIVPVPNPGTDPATCEMVWVSRKINQKYLGTSTGYWTSRPVGHQASSDEVMGADCEWDVNRILWLGGETFSTMAVWASKSERVRAITQGFVWLYPAILSNYMQIEPDGGDECQTECCIRNVTTKCI